MSEPRDTGAMATDRLASGVALLIALLGIGWRLVDLTEWPFPVFESVQYESAMASRALWLTVDPSARTPERMAWFEQARYQHIVSPPILPALVASSYAVAGEEIPWTSKLFAAAFWAGAGCFVYATVIRQTGCRWGGVVALGFLMFEPFGLMVSRSFQTESVAVFGLALGAWHLSRPDRGLRWRETIVAGLVCGAAGLAKPGTLLPPLAAAFASQMLATGIAGRTPRKIACVALFTLLLALPSGLYVAFKLSGRGSEIQPHLLGGIEFYEGQLRMIRNTVGVRALALGMAGALLAARRGWTLNLGLFAGHAVYLGIFTIHSPTHEYYQTILIALIALGLGWIVAELIHAISALGGRSPRKALALAAIVVAGLIRYAYVAKIPTTGPWRYGSRIRPVLAESRARQERAVEAVRAARDAMGPDARPVALTDEYGYVFEYSANLRVVVWPRKADLAFLIAAGLDKPGLTAEDRLDALIAAGRTHLVVVDFIEYDLWPDLKAALARRGRLSRSGPDTLVYELR